MFGRRVKREGGARVPVIAFTGFLGAGKTTLLAALLKRPEGAGSAVVVNEFGDIGIDDALLRASSDTTVLLDNGCMCCAVRTDLQETLRQLFHERAAGIVPSFSRVLIETSGLADPAPLLQTFLSDRALGREFHLNGLVGVVAAATLTQDMLARSPEAVKQIALADRIVLTKTDMVDAATTERAVDLVRGLNAAAPIAVAANGDVDPAFLLEGSVAPLPRLGMFAESVRHATGVETFTITFDEPLHWDAFARGMEALGTLRGPDLLRVKGLVSVRGCAGPLVVHFVQHLAPTPVELQDWPTEDRRSRLVFVTRGIERETVERVLRSLQALVG